MIIGVSFGQEDGLQIKQPKFLADQKIFHHPHKVLFNSRAFDLEVFTEYDKKQVKQGFFELKVNITYLNSL